MFKIIFFSIASVLIFAGCVSNQAVSTIQAGDELKSCEEIKAELRQLGVKFEDAKDDSGLTGKNVDLAVVFWPGIIVNEVRSNKNQDSIDNRISHLTAIYNRKCLGAGRDEPQNLDLKTKLNELKELHDQDLISDEEYEIGRKKVLGDL